MQNVHPDVKLGLHSVYMPKNVGTKPRKMCKFENTSDIL